MNSLIFRSTHLKLYQEHSEKLPNEQNSAAGSASPLVRCNERLDKMHHCKT